MPPRRGDRPGSSFRLPFAVRFAAMRPVDPSPRQHVPASSSTDEEATAFLQGRVSAFGLTAGGLGGGFLLVRLLTAGFDEGPGSLEDADVLPSLIYHALGVLPLLSAAVLTQRGTLSAPRVKAIETIALLTSSIAYQLMGTTIPAAYRPDLIVVLALTFGFVARAVYVPSRARRTAMLGIALLPTLLVSVWIAYAGFDPPIDVYEIPGEEIRRFTMIETTLWWSMSIAISTLTSRTLYGLRKEAASLRRLGQYTLEAKLGEGGMGRVYRARHAMLKRPTAVKVLLPDRAGAQGLARFEREVQLTARLTHPHTVTVFDYGRTPEGLFYYAMELLDGATLGEVVEVSGAQPAGRVVAILDAVAGALAEAHDVGLIHRDVKPANIMLSRRGGVRDFPKVLDFGLVKEMPGEDDPSAVELTHGDTLAGTPLYMSPEAIATPHAVDGRSDLYALGAVAYYLLTGSHVFVGRTSVEVCSHHLHAAPEPPSARLGAAIPPALERLVLSCLAKAPDDRPGSALALQRALRQIAGDVAPWTDEDADGWWARYGAALETHRTETGQTSESHTLDVALAS